MKRETARREIGSLDFYLQNHTDDYNENSHMAMMMAVDALKSSENLNNVLGKIRAEIADLDDADYDYEGYYKAVTDALKIIDKYKAESEE